MNPRVFISHASEDKERFVLSFASKLLSIGIDAWVDKWEMSPGDSLVDKVFEEGIKNAQAMIIVLSSYSVDKPWVKEELNAGMVKRINEGSKLIPVLLDDCVIPECLKSTVHVRIKDHDNCKSEIDSIVMSILGHTDKPPVGTKPKYATIVIDKLPGLEKIDTLILKISCEEAIKIGHKSIDTADLLKETELLELPRTEVMDSLEILERQGHLELDKLLIGDISSFKITVYGFDNYARQYIDNFDAIVTEIISKIVNEGISDNETLSTSTKQPMTIVDHILYILDNNDLISISESQGGGYLNIGIFNVSPELKRMLN